MHNLNYTLEFHNSKCTVNCAIKTIRMKKITIEKVILNCIIQNTIPKFQLLCNLKISRSLNR